MKALEPALCIDGVRAGYGEAVVLDDLSLALATGESLAVLGRNGVGKTTLLATIMGHTRLHRGRIDWQGNDLVRLAPHKRVSAGIGWVVQERGIFPSLSVEENLAVSTRPGPWNATRIYEVFPGLNERRRNKGNQLSGGEQQMLAIGRCLSANPALLLLDEPMEGLAPIIVRDIVSVIHRLIAEAGMTVILVEQHARLALSLTNRAIVLDRGRIVYSGLSAELLTNSDRLEALIGVKADWRQ
jgi:branched-chain amino acid transport system ATP-binding protein